MNKTLKKQVKTRRKKHNTPFFKLRMTQKDIHGKTISQKELANRLKVYCPIIDEKKIERIENERVKSIDIDIYKAYMQYFGVSADYLLGFSNIPKRFDNDVIGCADYLGISRKAVETIHSMFENPDELLDIMSCDEILHFLSDQYTLKELQDIFPDDISDLNDDILDIIKSDNDIKNRIKKDLRGMIVNAGYAFDMILSNRAKYNSSYFCIEFFYKIYCMYQEHVQTLDENGECFRSYRMYLIDIMELLKEYIEHFDIFADNKRSIDFDLQHNTNIHSQLYGD